MYNVNIRISNNELCLVSKKHAVTEGNLNSIQCVFDFPEEYDELTCIAVFTKEDGTKYKRTVVDNKSTILSAVLVEGERITIGVYAYKLNDNDEFELMYSSRPIYLEIEQGSYVRGSETEDEFEVSEFEQFSNSINQKYSEIKEINDNMQNTANNAVKTALANNMRFYTKDDGKLYLSIRQEEDDEQS